MEGEQEQFLFLLAECIRVLIEGVCVCLTSGLTLLSTQFKLQTV